MFQRTLRFQEILPDGSFFHLTRAILPRARPRSLHGHDFYELLWVQNGKVRQHLPGSTEELTEGDLLFVTPDHRHALQGRGDEAMVVSITLHPGLVADLRARHPSLDGQLFWAGQARPVRHHRDIRQLADLNHAALRLERSGRSRLEAEAFLLPLCASLLDEVSVVPPTAPDWLAQACAAALDPKVFRDGAAGFARVAGKAHAHVSRVARQHLGQTPSDYVNDIRMTWAARRLSGTNDSLAEIAAECGIPNLSHFHRLFLSRHGTTPHQYRKRMQRNVLLAED